MNKIISLTPLTSGVQTIYRLVKMRDTKIVKLSLDPGLRRDERSVV